MRGIEPLALAWKAKVLPLYEPRTIPHQQFRSINFRTTVWTLLISAPLFSCWWRGLDSNQRTRKRADLQSAAINHSATCPSCRQVAADSAAYQELAKGFEPPTG